MKYDEYNYREEYDRRHELWFFSFLYYLQSRQTLSQIIGSLIEWKIYVESQVIEKFEIFRTIS